MSSSQRPGNGCDSACAIRGNREHPTGQHRLACGTCMGHCNEVESQNTGDRVCLKRPIAAGRALMLQ
eukprot:15466632-Alexandrium_andersonii.AAC.1